MRRSKSVAEALKSSFWFIPLVMVVCCSAVAVALVYLESSLGWAWGKHVPTLFEVSPDGARGILTAVAGSMMTVTSVAFSMTLVALALAASQYSSRILRNFMRDRITQFTLGSFAGIFVYCLIVLRTIGSDIGEQEFFVPGLGVSFGVLLAIAGIGVLIFFIHHIASSIQAASIVASVARETLETIDELFPHKLGEAPDEDGDAGDAEASQAGADAGQTWHPIPAPRSGYIQDIDGAKILQLVCEHQTLMRMEQGIGEFVVSGTALASLALKDTPDSRLVDAIQNQYSISRQRTPQSDAAFGIRQLVDVALRAISPSLNDTTTAVMCVDYLSAILARLVTCDFPSRYRYEAGSLRVIAKRHDFGFLVAKSFDQIRNGAAGNVTILWRMLHALETIAQFTTRASRSEVLDFHRQRIAEVAERSVQSPHDRVAIEKKLISVRDVLAARSAPFQRA